MGERIACLGWGSLIWDPGELRVDGDWQHDGPKIKVEFVRRSDSGLLTLVFFNDAKPVCSQWIWMAAEDLDGAIDNLATREGRGNPIPRKYIGQWPNGDAEPRIIDLESWAEKQGTDYVIWTALPPKFRNPETGRFENYRWPSENDAVDYLRDELPKGKLADAKEYVINAPVDTAYRRRILSELQWE